MFRSAQGRVALARLDIGQLLIRERACLRLLYRCEAATAGQLATMVSWSHWNAHYRLRRLFRAGLLERAPLAPERGGVPIAYRLSYRGRQRLGYTDWRPRGSAHLRHTLDIVETACGLVRHGLLQSWLTESMSGGVLRGVRPDSIVELQAASGWAAVCLEIDEATERMAKVSAKLDAYGFGLVDRPRLKVLFVVPNSARAAWLARVAGWSRHSRLAGRCWAVVLDDVRLGGLSAPVLTVGWRGQQGTLAQLLDDPTPRRFLTPVGSEEWVQLLATGGGEDLDPALN